MSSDIINTPVVFFIFNRPDLTAKVFAAIEKAQPAKLYIIADGPRIIENLYELAESMRLKVKHLNVITESYKMKALHWLHRKWKTT